MKIGKSFTFYIVLSLVAVLLLSLFFGQNVEQNISYSSFIAMLEVENPADCPIASVELKDGTANIKMKADYGEFKKDQTYKMYYDSTDSIHALLDTFKQKQLQAGIKDADGLQYKIVTTPTIWILIMNVLPFLLLVAGVVLVWYFMMNQANNSNNKAMNFAKSRARLATDSKKKVTFQDVAGAAEEKEELEELVEFLKDPGKYAALGARIPKGVLLVGPPGTGKTLLARAVAGEAGVPFFTISGSDFVEMYVGVGASRVRDMFNQAKKNAPCIVFIDEIDAVGRHRGAGLGGGHDEREQTLNQLLVEMDGFQMNDGVIIIAATNRKDILDPALLRPGRFDRQVYVNLPDVKEREAILKVHARNKPLTDDVHLNEIAQTTPGFSGADLENLLNEAALIAARKKKKTINMEDVKEATFKVIMGPEKKSKVISDKDKKWTAYHEAGHALAVRFKSTVMKVDRVSIIPAGRAGGYTSYRPEDDSMYSNKTEMMQSIIIALGGKVAEELVFHDCSSGTVSDLNRANAVARNMVTKLGMSSKVGNVVYQDENDAVFVGLEYGHSKNYSEALRADVDAEVKAILDACYEECRKLLEEHIDLLHRLAEILVMKERIEGEEFEAIVDGTWDETFGKPVEAEAPVEAPTEAAVEESTEAVATEETTEPVVAQEESVSNDENNGEE